MPAGDSDLAAVEVDAETAFLLYALAEPGPLPDHVLADLSESERRTIAGLVADHVLEIETAAGFLSGTRALGLFADAAFEPPRDRLVELAHAALRYATALDATDEPTIAVKLYRYHTLPASARRRRAFPDAGTHLGFDALDDAWRVSAPTSGWFHLRRDSQVPATTPAKLYVSPEPDALAAAVRATARATAAVGGTFKVGAGLHGALRPDKLVAYFPAVERLRRAADIVQDILADTRAHGVPFTAALRADGLLSWGVDPTPLAPAGAVSWRQWVVERAAVAIAAARREAASQEPPWRLALARLALDGIDPANFQPGADWIEAHG